MPLLALFGEPEGLIPLNDTLDEADLSRKVFGPPFDPILACFGPMFGEPDHIH